MNHSFFKRFCYFIAVIILLSCVSQKKKGEYKGLAKFYHNTSAKYNAYFNANELLDLSIDKLNNAFKDDYNKLIPVFPYESLEDVNFEKASLDKAIEKLGSDITIHKYSRWADDCYFLLAKAQYLKKDYETAESSYEYLLYEYTPKKIVDKSKSLKAKRAKVIKKEKEVKKSNAKKAAQKRTKEKIKAREAAKKKAAQNKAKNNKTKALLDKGYTGKQIEELNYNEEKAKPVQSSSSELTNVGSKLIPHRPIYWEASIWSAKNLIRRGKFYEAEYKLEEIQNDPATSNKLKGELFATKAQLYITTDKYDKAITELKNAIEYTKSKKLKARYSYILGQIYQLNGRPVSSDEYFAQVIKYHPNYEMYFHAKLNLILNKSLQGENEESFIKSLEKLAKDSKNDEYVSEIYLSIGKVYYNNKKFEEAISFLNKAANDPSSKSNIKSDAYYLLANINFDRAQFQSAKYYFDSTLLFLAKSDKRRPTVSKMISNLKDIAEQIEIINLQDSLIRISGLSNKEKRALALELKNRKKNIVNPNDVNRNQIMDDKIIRSPLMNRNANVLNSIKDSKNNSNKSSFFAYDIKSANRGRASFDRDWGERVLEDNWRRSNKTSFNTNNSEIEQKKDSAEKTVIEEDLAELLAGIPSSKEEIKAAHKKIQEAMFLLGVAYRDRIESYQRSKETLEELLSKYPETDRQADALYYLYLDCLDLKDQACADKNNQILKTRFADSYYSKLINDPEFAKSLMNKKNELDLAYEKAYTLFNQNNFEESHKILQALATKVKAENPLHAKIALLSTFCIGKTSGKEPYMEALKDVIAKYPGTPQESKAKEILRLLRGDKEAFETVNVVDLESIDFSVEDDKQHFMMIVFFNPPPKQVDKAKISISDYHQKYHKLDNLKMTSIALNVEENIFVILIRIFDNKSQAMKYYNAVQKNREEYIPSYQGYDIYPVTQNNYREILKLQRVKEYQVFFKKNYEEK